MAAVQAEVIYDPTVRIPLTMAEFAELKEQCGNAIQGGLVGLILTRRIASWLSSRVTGTLREAFHASLDGRGDIELSEAEFALVSGLRSKPDGRYTLRIRNGNPRLWERP